LEINLLYNLSELFTYNPAVSKIKGVVGNPGTTSPAIPKQSERVPKTINITLTRFM
jgi:hypothetical protein